MIKLSNTQVTTSSCRLDLFAVLLCFVSLLLAESIQLHALKSGLDQTGNLLEAAVNDYAAISTGPSSIDRPMQSSTSPDAGVEIRLEPQSVEEPSLEDTFGWLSEYLATAHYSETWREANGKLRSTRTLSYGVKNVHVVDCTIGFDRTRVLSIENDPLIAADGIPVVLSPLGGGPYTPVVYTVKLQEVSDVIVRPVMSGRTPDRPFVTGSTHQLVRPADEVVLLGPSGFARSSESRTYVEVGFAFEDRGFATRIAKGLSHAAKLCAAKKKTLFK